MAEHGYARDYDEPVDRGDDRGRWRGESQDRQRRGSGRDEAGRNERNVDFMLGDSDRSWERGRDRARGSNASNHGEFRDRGAGMRSSHWSDNRQHDRAEGAAGRSSRGADYGSGWEQPEGRFRSGQDDHYRTWRNRQMEALDRDYADYCREREQQFHRDFDNWRERRRNRGQSDDESVAVAAEREMTHQRAMSGEGNTPSPVGAATLGTNNSENTGTGRAKPTP